MTAQEMTPRLYAPAPTGGNIVVPLGRRSSLKVAWATGFTTRVGADFDTIGVALQTVWFRKP